MKQATWREKLGVALEAGRRAWGMVSKDQLPVIIEAQTLKDLTLEDQGWRLLDGTRLDMKPWSHRKMQEVAFNLYRHNHMAQALLEILTDFIWGDGISVVAKHENEGVQDALQETIDEFWFDPINQMDRLTPQRILELFLWGEGAWTVQRNELNGALRLGWIDPTEIEDVAGKDQFGRPTHVTVSDTAAEQIGVKVLEIVRFLPEEGTWDGNVFFMAVNSVMSSYRGVSELFTAADWLDVISNTLKAHADRAKLDAHFIWDVELVGMTEAQIKEWYKKNGAPPKPNTVRAHNDKVKWSAVSPSLGSADMGEHVRTLKTWIMGGFRYPNHWFASGDDANLATAQAMNEPTRKHLKNKQKFVRNILSDIVRYALISKQSATGALGEIDFTSETPFEVQIPDFSGPDVAKAGSAIAQITQSVLAAVDGELVSLETAQEAFAMALSEIGMEIDVSMEREKIEGDRDQRQAQTAERERARAELIQQQLRVAQQQNGQQTGQPPQNGAAEPEAQEA